MRFFFVAACLFFIAGCESTINSTSDAKARFATHKTVAILPFEVNFDLDNGAKKFSKEEMANLKLDMSLRLQNHLYNLLRRNSGKQPLKVDVQNTYRTNEILAEKQITFTKVFDGSKIVLCNLLGVDAVITPQVIFAKSNPLSKGEMRMQILINDKKSEDQFWWFNRVKENKVNVESYFSLTGKFIPMPNYGDYTEYPEPKNDKQKVLNPIFVLIDEVLESFVNEFPYLKKSKFY